MSRRSFNGEKGLSDINSNNLQYPADISLSQVISTSLLTLPHPLPSFPIVSLSRSLCFDLTVTGSVNHYITTTLVCMSIVRLEKINEIRLIPMPRRTIIDLVLHDSNSRFLTSHASYIRYDSTMTYCSTASDRNSCRLLS